MVLKISFNLGRQSFKVWYIWWCLQTKRRLDLNRVSLFTCLIKFISEKHKLFNTTFGFPHLSTSVSKYNRISSDMPSYNNVKSSKAELCLFKAVWCQFLGFRQNLTASLTFLRKSAIDAFFENLNSKEARCAMNTQQVLLFKLWVLWIYCCRPFLTNIVY